MGSTWDSTTSGAYVTSSDDIPPVSGWMEWCSSAWAESPLSVVDMADRQVQSVTCQTGIERNAFTFKAVLNGKAGYESAAGKYLYWRADTGRWYMGGTWDSTSSGAYVTSSEDEPPSSGWREYCSSAWEDSFLSVRKVGCRNLGTTPAHSECRFRRSIPGHSFVLEERTCSPVSCGAYQVPDNAIVAQA